jgi:SAM-dependent methyltransferase
MNRQQRRAAQRRTSQPDEYGPGSAPPDVLKLCAEAAWQHQRGNFDNAVRLYRRALALKPDFAQALNNLGCSYLAQNKLDKAAETFRQLLFAMPELLDSYADVVAILLQVNPAMREALARASADWPDLPRVKELFGPAGIGAVAGDPLLRSVLEAIPVCAAELERLMTAVRREMLREATAEAEPGPQEAAIGFYCALAKQCFINEYVFVVSESELADAQRLKQALAERLAANERIPPLWLATVASYFPLHRIAGAAALLDRKWPDSVDSLLTQQLREPAEEQNDRPTIPILTAIDDAVSVRVREQYEENPYPRWVLAPSRRAPVEINSFLRTEFPGASFRDLESAAPEMLIAGCGTGQQSIGMARMFKDVRVFAVDLSLTSLCHAKRKTRELGLKNIEYAQADILQLGSIGRTFDIIDASGVLHHMADPLAAWQMLLALLRPRGLMKVSLYSELARREIVAARAFIAERGYHANADDIRRCRQDIVANTPFKELASIHDFYSMSECRDLLFHVHEHRLTIPQIKSFLAANALNFLGFKVSPTVRAQYAARFPDDRAMTDLDRWAAFEQDNPDTFGAMYQLWLQRS